MNSLFRQDFSLGIWNATGKAEGIMCLNRYAHTHTYVCTYPYITIYNCVMTISFFVSGYIKTNASLSSVSLQSSCDAYAYQYLI